MVNPMYPLSRRIAIVLLVAGVMAACRFNLNNDSTSSSTSGGVTLPGAPTPIPTPTPTPTPIPTPTPTPGGRTADPPPGAILPAPLYGAGVVASVPADVSLSCT